MGAKSNILLAAACMTFVSCAYFSAHAQDAKPAAEKPLITVTSRPYDVKQIVAIAAAVPENIYRGRSVWQQRCSYCHDGVGQPSYHTMGPWIGAETVEQLTEDGMKAFIEGGTDNMPGFRYTLKPQQEADLIAFIKTIPASQKPTELQLNGGNATPTGVGGD